MNRLFRIGRRPRSPLHSEQVSLHLCLCTYSVLRLARSEKIPSGKLASLLKSMSLDECDNTVPHTRQTNINTSGVNNRHDQRSERGSVQRSQALALTVGFIPPVSSCWYNFAVATRLRKLARVVFSYSTMAVSPAWLYGDSLRTIARVGAKNALVEGRTMKLRAYANVW